MPVPDQHRIKWEAEVSIALSVYTLGRLGEELIENDYTNGKVDIDDVWTLFESDTTVLDHYSIELTEYLRLSLMQTYLELKEDEDLSVTRIARRHLQKFG